MQSEMAVLLRPQRISLKRSFSGRNLIKNLPFIMLTLFFWLFIYVGTYKGVVFLRNIDVFGDIVISKLIFTIFFSLTGFLFLSNLITAISSFYLAKDLQLLRFLPIKVGEILSFKTVQTFLSSSWMAISFLPPVLIALGVAAKAPIYYYLLIFIFFVLFSLILSGIGITSAHLLTRFFPARRLKEAFLFVGLVIFVGAYFLFRNLVPSDFNDPMEFIDAVAFSPNLSFLPDYWLSNLAISMIKGEKIDILFVSLLLSNALFFIMASLELGKRVYAGNVERLSGDRSGNGLKMPDIYPKSGFSITYKDIKLFFRDAGQWSQLLIILSLVLVYVYNFKAIPLDVLMEVTPLAKDFLVLLNMLLCGLVMSAVAGRFVYPSVSLEGEAFWVIRSAPVDMKSFLLNKFFYGSIPLTILTASTLTLTNVILGVSGPLFYISTATVVLLSVSISGLGTGLGAAYPKFKYDNIASVSISLGAMAFMLIAFFLVLITVSIEAFNFYLYYKNGRADWTVISVSLVAIILINFLSAYIPLRVGVRRLRALEK